MIEMEINKIDFGDQLWPMSVDDTLVFGTSLLSNDGLIGVKNNNLRFIPMGDVPDKLAIQVPENLEEVMGFLGTADYILNRIMMTPKITVDGFKEVGGDELHLEVMTIFNNFMRSYHGRVNSLDRIKNGW